MSDFLINNPKEETRYFVEYLNTMAEWFGWQRVESEDESIFWSEYSAIKFLRKLEKLRFGDMKFRVVKVVSTLVDLEEEDE